MNKLLLFFIGLLSINSFSQSQISNQYSVLGEKLKSPQIHLLKQFVDQPVDLSRGLVDISVPLYDVQFADKTFPISVMFHASGLKANAAENGLLGLKWALNAGGFISREVKGMPDEQRNHKQGISVNYQPDWITLYGGGGDKGNYFANNVIFQNYDLAYVGMPGVYGKYEDTEYDLFTFSLPNGQSGKFILKDINGSKTASFMPYKPFKMNNPTVEGNNLVKFEIIDDEGYTYTFGKKDATTGYYELDIELKYINTWMLTSITSPNKKDIITFDYISSSVEGNSPLAPVVINDNLEDSNNYYFKPQCQSIMNSAFFDAVQANLYDSGGYFQKNYNEPAYLNQSVFYVNKITYNDLIVNFNYGSQRILTKIEVLKNNKITKKVTFDVGSPEILNSINIMGETDEIIEKYRFDYYNLNKLPTSNQLANKSDYWGYYQSQVENIIVKDTVDIFFTYPGCDTKIEVLLKKEIGSGTSRYSNAEDMKTGMVKSITYPTGGTTNFDYEGNQYKDGNITRDCGGLRIKSIIYKDKNGIELKKREFTYGQNEDGIGTIASYLKPDPYFLNPFEEFETRYYIQDDRPQISSMDQGTYTTRYYKGSFPSNYYTYLYNLVSYDKVTEYYGVKNNNTGKTENFYYCTIPTHSDYEFNYNRFTYQKYKYIIDPSNFWNGNHISKKIDYKNTNGLYSRVKQTDYSYEETILDEIYDLSIFRFKNFVGYSTAGNTPIIPATEELDEVKNHPTDVFGYKTQKYVIGIENLSSTREELFFDDGKSIIQTTINKYDVNKPAFIKESSSSNSKGENLVQKFLYPFNINTGVYSQMTTANILSPLVEKIALKNDKVISGTVLTYKKSDENFVPDQDYITELNTPVPLSGFTNFNGVSKDSRYSSSPEITYNLYDDKGNPTQITPKGKASVCYIWGYDKKYPIAKIENASFLTGQTNSITAAQQTLINNAVAASFGENTPATENNLISKLKLLREGFPNAMVTTYTYDPLIGITSMTDPKEYTTYYEYDTYGRLKQVKDNNGKILSANKYHYTN